jgi:hypothetical protein
VRVLEYFGGELPSDTTLKEHLILTEKFNPDSVDTFIGVLRETLALVKLPSVGYALPERQSDADTKTVATSRQSQIKPMHDWASTFSRQSESPLPSGQLPFPLYLSKTQKATLYVPSSMTRKEYDLLKQQIENSLAVMEATILADDQTEAESRD